MVGRVTCAPVQTESACGVGIAFLEIASGGYSWHVVDRYALLELLGVPCPHGLVEELGIFVATWLACLHFRLCFSLGSIAQALLRYMEPLQSCLGAGEGPCACFVCHQGPSLRLACHS